MTIREIQFNLPSNDPQESARIYVQGLFFRSIAAHSDLGLFTVALGDFQISFVRTEDASLIAMPSSRYFLFSVQTEGIEDYYKRVCGTGLVRIENELDYYPGGNWQFSIIDNNGFRIGFNQKG